MRNRGAQFRVRFAVDGDGKIVSTFEAVHAGASKARQPVEGLAAEVVQLSDRLDKGAAATRQYAQDQAVLDAAMKQGLITAREHTRLMDKAYAQTPDGERWRKFGESIGRSMLWAGGAVAAASALVVRNTMAWENQLAQLEAAHASTGNAVGMTREQLVGLAEDLSRASTFGRNEIVEAETRLLSYSGIVGTNFPRAMQAVIDQSARLGISVAQSAETIGRALESPAKAAAALSDQGFGAAFTEEVRATIDALVEAGREADAQIMILEILEESYAGAAQAARDTFGGALITLKNRLADLMTGDDGSLNGARDALNDLIDTLEDPRVKDGLDGFATGAINVTSALAQMIAKLGEAGVAVKDVFFSGTAGQSTQLLSNRATDLESELFEAQRQADAFDRRRSLFSPSNLLGGRTSAAHTRVQELESELAEVEAELQRRRTRSLVAAAVDEALGPEPAAAPPSPPGGGDPRTPPGGGAGAQAIDEEDKALERLQGRMQSYLERLTQANELEAARAESGGKNMERVRAEYEIQATGLDELNPKMAEAIRLEADLRDRQREKADIMADGERTIAANRTALDRLTQALAKYDEQLAANAISQADHAAAVAAARGEYEASEERTRRANQSMTEAMLEDWANLDRAIDFGIARSLDDISQALTDFATRGEMDIKRLGATILETFARIMMDKAIADFIGAITGAGGGNTGTGGGFWQNVIGAFAGAMGNRASGGGVSGSGVYEITEHGRPELLRQGSQTYLLPGRDGVVMPLQPMLPAGGTAAAGGGMVLHQHFNFTGGTGQGETNAGEVAAAQREFAARMRSVAQEEIGHAMRPGGPLWRAGVTRQ